MTVDEIRLADAPDDVVEGEIADFLRAGGSFSWRVWAGMEEREKACAVRAGVLVERERAQMLVDALFDSAHEEIVDHRVERALDAAERRSRRGAA